MRFREKLQRFMWGRYGIDGFYYGLFATYIFLWIAQGFVKINVVKALMSIAGFVVLVYMIYRVFSKNIPARRKENERFMRAWKKVKGYFVLQKNKIRDIKHFTYKKCPACKSVLRLPRKKGKHNVVCPKCKNRFGVRNLF